MSAGHTPGPWKLTETTHEKIISSWDIQAGEHQINVFPYKRIYSDDGAKSGLVIDKQKMADARLIAAAPELLEALKGVVKVADRATVEFDAARAAINKTEGAAA